MNLRSFATDHYSAKHLRKSIEAKWRSDLRLLHAKKIQSCISILRILYIALLTYLLDAEGIASQKNSSLLTQSFDVVRINIAARIGVEL
ncbi:hypothetical protein IF2G_10962 [Cordyceps javanica]|nr:hypothetical protein IF2G_10962 [Cordyceps javanica]